MFFGAVKVMAQNAAVAKAFVSFQQIRQTPSPRGMPHINAPCRDLIRYKVDQVFFVSLIHRIVCIRGIAALKTMTPMAIWSVDKH
jgi:hypothetical protein